MAQYTFLKIEEIHEILSNYPVGKIISFEPLKEGGLENTNYLVSTLTGKYVLSVCEQKTSEEAKELAVLLMHLEKNNFKTSIVINTNDSKPVLIWNNKPLMLKKYIEGKIQKELSPNLLKLIGYELASLHSISPPKFLPSKLNYGKEKFSIVKKYSPNSEFDVWINDILKYMSPYFDLDLPRGLIHSDLFYDNVIISKDQKSVTIMDLEESANYYRVFDIGMTFIGICAEKDILNIEKASHILNGYQQKIKLSKHERDSLQAFTVYAGASMTFWRYMNFNFTKPNPKLSNHYLGLKVLTDYIQSLTYNSFSKIFNK